jgi:hypothetical protein
LAGHCCSQSFGKSAQNQGRFERSACNDNAPARPADLTDRVAKNRGFSESTRGADDNVR